MSVQPVHRVHDEAAKIAKQIAFIRDIVARAVELLELPRPDTFLGRKTQEPFPQEESRYGEAQDSRPAA